MNRERALKVVLVVVGVLFVGAVYPLVLMFSQQPAVAMMMSIYVTLGIFLLWAARNPMANRHLILFAGWANLAHAALMAFQAYRKVIESRELIGVMVFGVIGIVLVAMAPTKESAGRTSAAGA